MSGRKLTLQLDKAADTAYLSLGVGELCTCEEFDDAILVERGIFSSLIGGFRILNFSKYGKGSVALNRLKDIFRALLVKNSHVAKFLQSRDEIIQAAPKTIDKKLEAIASPARQ